VTAASGVSVFFVSLLVFTLPIFLKPLVEEFSWSRQSVSTAFAVAATMSAVWAPPLGYLADRLGPRRIIVPCMALFGLAFTALSALTPRLWHLYILFAAMGTFGTGASPVVYARAVTSWLDERRGVALAAALSGRSLGGIVHPTTAAALIPIVGWRGTCLTFGGLVLAIGLPIVSRFIRERPSVEVRIADRRQPAAGTSIADGRRSRVFWMLVIMLVGPAPAQNGPVVHMSALLTDRGVSASRAAAAVSATAAASVVGRLAAGWLLDRFFAARVSFALIAASACGTFLLARADSFASGTIAAVLLGIGIGGESDVAPYLLSRYFGLRPFSTLYGLTWIATAAEAAGPILMGRAFDATGSYEALLIRFAILTLSVALLMLTLPRHQHARTERPAAV